MLDILWWSSHHRCHNALGCAYMRAHTKGTDELVIGTGAIVLGPTLNYQ